MKTTTTVLACLLVCIGSAQAADKTITVEGPLMIGRFESAIVAVDGIGVSLAPDSAVTKQVMSVCQKGALCKVTGVVDDADPSRLLKAVSKVERVKK
jgi:hypothetical protein